MAKSEYMRTRDEKELLVELDEIDRTGTLTDAEIAIQKRGGIFSGPAGTCACCGRNL